MTERRAVLFDTSVAFQFFIDEDENEVLGARALLRAHVDGRSDGWFLDLTYAAVALRRGAMPATVDRQLVRAGLGEPPADVVAALDG